MLKYLLLAAALTTTGAMANEPTTKTNTTVGKSLSKPGDVVKPELVRKKRKTY